MTSKTNIKRISRESAEWLAACRFNAQLRLDDLRKTREERQDDTEYLISTVHETVVLEMYCNQIKHVLQTNNYRDLL